MPLTKLTIEEVQEHIDECCDGADCKFRTAQAWADGVAAPGRASEIRDLMMALHLADIKARDRLESVEMLTTLLAAIVRREPMQTLSIEREECIERIERLVVEHDDETGRFDLTMIGKPDGDGSLS
jgi:hypothetical protein